MANIEASTAKLAGLQIDLLQKLRDGQLTLEQLEWFCRLTLDRRGELQGADLSSLKPFMPSVTVGDVLNYKGASKLLSQIGVVLGDSITEFALREMNYLQSESKVKPIIVSQEELGLPSGVSDIEVFEAALSKGYKQPPAELAVKLWIQYPYCIFPGRWCVIASERIVTCDGTSLLSLGYSNGARKLRAIEIRDGTSKGNSWSDFTNWMFVQ